MTTLPITTDETISQGATWRRAYRWLPGGVAQNFTGWSARLQVRADFADYTSGISLSLTTGAGITLDASGNIVWTATDSQTAALTKLNAQRYDLELVDSLGAVTSFVRGAVTLLQEVTR